MARHFASPGAGSIFKWDTLRTIGSLVLRFRGLPVAGQTIEVELAGGQKVRAWRSDDGQKYFCHGLTFGGKDAPGGIISPYTGWPVETILRHHFEALPEALARPGDILVWKGIGPETTPHSAAITDPVVTGGTSYLHETTRLRSKNGLLPEANLTLEALMESYGESYNLYRRR